MPDASALAISKLKFAYDRRSRKAGDWVVDIDSLELHRGEQTLLTGGSGRGKSTLLHLVAGLIEPHDGVVRVDGDDIHALAGHRRDLFRGNRIGMIFQTFNLLPGFSALENVMLAMTFSEIPRGEHKPKARAMLEHLGIEHPNRDATRFSIGQQQRIAVARAMVIDPLLVLADEPTASLDPDNAGRAIELIQHTCREKDAALLCVSHDPALRDRFERCASLEALSGAVPAMT